MGADMYLAAAVILCDEMLRSYKSPIEALNSDQQIDKRCGFTSANPDYEMLMPVIFNLKHGTELYLKALIMQIHKNLEYPQTHDLYQLLNMLIAETLNNKIQGIDMQILDQKVRTIINKYYYGLYAFAVSNNQPDINNEAERYPEYRNPNCYKIDNLFKIEMNTLLQQVKKDCVTIQKYFREDILKKLPITN